MAQDAAAFAGFVGVVLVILSRGGALPRLQTAGFLQGSLGAVVFALLPEFFVEVLPNEKTTWQLLCGLFGLYHLLIFVNYLSKHKYLKKMGLLQKSISIASIPVIGLKLAAGDPLPSIRQLANDLDLNNKTVAKAYRLLERDAVIQTKGYRGTFVHPDAVANSAVDLQAWVQSIVIDAIKACRDAGATDSEIRIAFGNVMQNRTNEGE